MIPILSLVSSSRLRSRVSTASPRRCGVSSLKRSHLIGHAATRAIYLRVYGQPIPGHRSIEAPPEARARHQPTPTPAEEATTSILCVTKGPLPPRYFSTRIICLDFAITTCGEGSVPRQPYDSPSVQGRQCSGPGGQGPLIRPQEPTKDNTRAGIGMAYNKRYIAHTVHLTLRFGI